MIIKFIVVIFIFYALYAKFIEKRSIESKIMENFMFLAPIPNVEDDLNNKKEFTFKLSSKYKTTNKIINKNLCDMDVLIMNEDSKNDKVIIYIHGGCYLYNLNKEQLSMIDKLCSKTNNTVYIPLYPLLPNNNYLDAYDKLLNLYTSILEKFEANNIIFMGDSAGGSLCLGLSMLIKEKKLPQPSQIILVSPWLDISLTNKNIDVFLSKKDKILDKDQLLTAANLWSKGQDLNNYLLSPINGDLNNLPPITIFIGTYDILYPDVLVLQKKLIQAQNKTNIYVYEKMLHVFTIFPIPEANKAINEIADIINQST